MCEVYCGVPTNMLLMQSGAERTLILFGTGNYDFYLFFMLLIL